MANQQASSENLQITSLDQLITKYLNQTSPDANSEALLQAPFFNSEYPEKANVLQQLLVVFGCPNENLDLQKISLQKNAENVSFNIPFNLNSQCSYIAGILLYDLVKNNIWWQALDSEEKQISFFKHLVDLHFEGNYVLKNLQARILSQILIHKYPQVWNQLLEVLVDILQNAENSDQIDVSLRSMLYFLQAIEDERSVKQFHTFVPQILPALQSAFMNDELVDAHGREQILEVLYYCLRTVSWADGIDNEIVENSLSETFNNWMALFLQIIQTNPRSFFDIKKSALKCLTVIFRDFINYSRECLGMILKPAWKLLNFHVQVYTEIIGYQQSIVDLQSDDNQSEPVSQYLRGFESEDEGDDCLGVEGMTQNLIELLTTLVQRPNLQEVVRQGIIPLIQTVACYMVIPANRERYHYGDYNYFIHEKDEDIYKERSIRNSCLDLISSLIEVYGDQAVESVLMVIDALIQVSPKKDDQTQIKDQSMTTVQTQNMDEINIFEQSYISQNKKHFWKRREVALFLLGNFAEDISMYRIRNPQFDLRSLSKNILIKIDFNNARLKTLLRGATLWCANQLVEILPRDYEEIHSEILKLATDILINQKLISLKLVATRSLIKFSRKVRPDLLQQTVGDRFEQIIDQLTGLLDNSSIDTLYLPIEAFTSYSKLNEDIVAQMAPKITPKLLKFFKNFHNESSITQELLNLFKIWCNYDACRDIFVNHFIPFIMDIIDMYYKATPNAENKDQILVPQSKSAVEFELQDKEQKQFQFIDASILTHVMDLLNTLLKRTKDKSSVEFGKIMDLFPKLLEYVYKSDDMFLLLNGTSTLRTFIHLGSQEILKRSSPKDIIDVAKKLLLPSTNEQAAICLGNYIIQIFHKIEPKIDTTLLMSVVWKIYKSRMPSIVQSLILIFARLIHSHPKEIVEFLSETSIDNRISLKIVLDKWLLQQPLFRGYYTKNTTLSALLKIFTMRDPRIESLMVIGYNPSHSNINSEVNAPFKILSLMLRYLDNELNPKKTVGFPKRKTNENEEEKTSGLMSGYKMKRDLMGEGERLDTIDQNDDDDYQPPANLDYNDDEEEEQLGREDDEDSDEGKMKRQGAERIEVNLDDINDDDDSESLLGGSKGGAANTPGLFTIKESNDRGLADMETGSEVYMSELLAGFDMEDFDEAEEMNEEDLIELGDPFGNINLKNHVQDTLNDLIKKDKASCDYMLYCIRQLNLDDQELAKLYLKLPNTNIVNAGLQK